MIGTLIFNTVVIGFFSLIGVALNSSQLHIGRIMTCLLILTIFNIVMLAYEVGKASK